MSGARVVGSDVLLVGSLDVDLVVRAPRQPRPGETLIAGDVSTLDGDRADAALCRGPTAAVPAVTRCDAPARAPTPARRSSQAWRS